VDVGIEGAGHAGLATSLTAVPVACVVGLEPVRHGVTIGPVVGTPALNGSIAGREVGAVAPDRALPQHAVTRGMVPAGRWAFFMCSGPHVTRPRPVTRAGYGRLRWVAAGSRVDPRLRQEPGRLLSTVVSRVVV
jgi:hypothetical protein